MSCSEVIQHVENRKLSHHKQMEDLIQASKNNADNTAIAQLLYQSIKELILLQSNLPSANCAIGCVSQQDIIRILPTSLKKHKLFGLTVPLKPLNTFYICILPETFQNKQILLEVVIHEIAHALYALKGKAGYPHGDHFNKWGRLVLKRVNSSIERLPIPFCNCAKPSIKILNEKYKET